MAERLRILHVASLALMSRPAEKIKASVQEHMARTRIRMEFGCLKLPIRWLRGSRSDL